MPSTSVQDEPEVHTDLVATNIVDVTPLQIDESLFRTKLGEGIVMPLGNAAIYFGVGHSYSRKKKHMGMKGTLEQVDKGSDD